MSEFGQTFRRSGKQFPTYSTVFEIRQNDENLDFTGVSRAEAIPDDRASGNADVARQCT